MYVLKYGDLCWFEMAPVNPHFKGKPSFKGKNRNKNSYSESHSAGGNKKKKTWNPGNKFFQGSLQEGKTAVCMLAHYACFISFISDSYHFMWDFSFLRLPLKCKS